MAPAGIVPSLDEFEYGPACFGMRAEAGSVDELALQGGEEALAHGVVIAVADRAHGGPHAGPATAGSEGD